MQLAVGEHVAVDERPALERAAGAAAGRRRAADPVVEQPAAGDAAAVERSKYVSSWARPTCSNMPIELIASNGPSCDVAVVLEPDLDLTGEPGLGDPLLGQLGLAPRHGDADRPHAVVPRRVHHHPAPAAPDVEQSHARLERELAADQLVLRLLRGLEPDVGRVPHRARVRHRRAEHDPVEVVRDVVVVRDRRRVARLRVAPPAQMRLLRRWGQRPEPAGADEPERVEPLGAGEAQRGQLMAKLEQRRRCRLRRRGRRRRTPGRSRARRAR